MRNLKELRKKVAVTLCFLVALNFIFMPAAKADALGEVKLYLMMYYKDGVPVNIFNKDNINDIMEEIDDPYTKYMNKEEYEGFINNINKRVYGIGVFISKHKEGILVTGIISGGPAESEGIQAGDIIIAVEEQELKGMSLDEGSSYIKGELGTAAKLTVKREDKLLNFSVKRDEIKLPTVSSEKIDNHIGYLKISSFGIDTTGEFIDGLVQLQEENVDSYIIDLRNNLGGFTETAKEIAGTIIGNRKALIVRGGKENKAVYAYENEVMIDKPIIFLVNEYSASSSEILSSAVKDYDKALFIGEDTYGKGVSQLIIKLSDGGALKVTNEEFLSPAGRKINGIGISPNMNNIAENALNLARVLFSKTETGEFNFLKESSKKNFELVNNEDEYNDYILDGWKIDYEAYRNYENINKGRILRMKFKDEVDLEEFKKNFKLVNLKDGIEVECKIIQEEASVMYIDPVGCLESGGKYAMVLESGMKFKSGEQLEKSGLSLISVEKNK